MFKIEYTVGYFIINCKLYIPQAEILPFAEAYYNICQTSGIGIQYIFVPCLYKWP